MDKKLMKNLRTLDHLIKNKLLKLKSKYPEIISEIRGSGCHYGIIFKKKLIFLKKIIKLIPINFIRDPLFIDKIITTSVMEEYFSTKNVISSFTSNGEVILNISPPINCSKTIVEKKIDDLEIVLKKGLHNLVLKFIRKNIL